MLALQLTYEKNMKNKKKKIIVIITAIIIITMIGGISYWLFIAQPKQQAEKEKKQNETVEELPPIVPNEYLEQGEKFLENKNTEKLKEKKIYESYEFYSGKVTKGKNENRFLVEVKNTIQDILPEKLLQFILIDSTGNTIDELEIVIPTLQPEETLSLSLSTTKELKQVTNYQIKTLEDTIENYVSE